MRRIDKVALLTWSVIYPLITIIIWLGEAALAGLPTPIRTLILTGMLVPMMTYALMSVTLSVFRSWLGPDS